MLYSTTNNILFVFHLVGQCNFDAISSASVFFCFFFVAFWFLFFFIYLPFYLFNVHWWESIRLLGSSQTGETPVNIASKKIWGLVVISIFIATIIKIYAKGNSPGSVWMEVIGPLNYCFCFPPFFLTLFLIPQLLGWKLSGHWTTASLRIRPNIWAPQLWSQGGKLIYILYIFQHIFLINSKQ